MTQQSLNDLMFQLQRSAILMRRGGPNQRPHGHMCGGPMGGRMEGPMGEGPGGRPEGGPDRDMHATMRGQGLLLTLLLEEDDLPLKDLVEKMDIRPSSLSELVRKLQRAGLVETQEDAQDRRSVRVRLTDEGKTRAQELTAAREEKFAQLFGALTGEEQQTLLDLLTKLNESLAARVGEEDPRRGGRGPGDREGWQGGRGPRPFGHGPWGGRERMQRFFSGLEDGPEEIIDLEI